MNGCPLCDWARTFLIRNGIGFQEIGGSGDPVIELGIMKLTKRPQAEYPLLLFGAGKGWILGRNDSAYVRVVNGVRALFDAGAFNAASAPVEVTRAATKPNGEMASTDS